MTLVVNKLLAYDLTCIVRSWLFFCIFFARNNYAQDTVVLKDIEVNAKKIELSEIGKKTEVIDTTIKEQFKHNSVADLLSYNSSVFIKNYGPGSIATTSFRGGSAYQTAVLWNGFNLQNAMLGQADLALMPSLLFENVAIEYGGGSSLWGSGAMAGSIHLNNKLNFGQGLISSLNLGGGSFGLLNASVNTLWSKKRFVSSTKVYLNSSQNNFKYSDTLDKLNPIKNQKNSEYNFKGLLQEFKFLISTKQVISLNAWLTTNRRRLPNDNFLIESKTYQRDDAIRLTANWALTESVLKSIIRVGYFLDNINYTDSLKDIYSTGKVKTLMLENENYFFLHKNYQLNIALNGLSSSGSTQNYVADKTLSRISLLFGNRFSFLNDRLISYASARTEYFSVGSLPITGNVSIEYKLQKNILTKLNIAKVYRQPTLNELYWLPGGNPNLKAEQGYTYEGEVSYTKRINNFGFLVSGSAYSRLIDNWILWIPGANGNPSPVNIQKVWSRGTETTWRINYVKKKLRISTGIITGYVLSTVQFNSQENDNTINKQLIYTPRYTVNGNILLGFNNADLVFYHQYSGYRFTTGDNLSWLPPFHLSSLRFNYKVVVKEINLVLFAGTNNLLNVNYTVLAGRPMPLRNYEFGISIQTKSTNKTNNKQNK